ncbi:MAG: hypothetical protein FJ224_09190 [Lentisphaerae bacterium]|nr:hypothetical protein [Lentisphaerota bacterium]
MDPHARPGLPRVHARTALPLVLLLLTSCATNPAVMPYGNVELVPVKNPDCSAFIVIRQDWNHRLGFVDADNNLTIITADLDANGAIEAVLPSPDCGKVLILSSGEGHQFLAIYEVITILDGYDSPGALPAMTTLDPYPDSLADIRWIDENTLEFMSALDLVSFDPEQRRGEWPLDSEAPPARKWLWHLRFDCFEEAP